MKGGLSGCLFMTLVNACTLLIIMVVFLLVCFNNKREENIKLVEKLHTQSLAYLFTCDRCVWIVFSSMCLLVNMLDVGNFVLFTHRDRCCVAGCDLLVLFQWNDGR